jgi:hypothetical protein
VSLGPELPYGDFNQEEVEAMKEILPGLFHWATFHERIRQEVSSYYSEPSRALIDPRVPSEGLEGFEGRRQPRVILLTNRHHYRHSGRFQEAFGCPVFCNEAGLHEFVGGPEVKGFSFGEEVAPNIVALEVGAICAEETALYLKEVDGGVLAFADGLIRFTDGSLGFFPDFLLGDNPEKVKQGLRESLRRLLGKRFEHLLFAHGLPLIGGGKEALATFLKDG